MGIPWWQSGKRKRIPKMLYREVQEECGIKVSLVRWIKDFYPNGWVAFCEPLENEDVDSWTTEMNLLT